MSNIDRDSGPVDIPLPDNTMSSSGTTTIGRRKRFGKNAARERTRVQQLKLAFINLQRSLPNVPEDTKLSRLDILLLTINYITHLKEILSSADDELDGGEADQPQQGETQNSIQKKQKPPNNEIKRSNLIAHSQWLYRSSLKIRKSTSSMVRPADGEISQLAGNNGSTQEI